MKPMRNEKGANKIVMVNEVTHMRLKIYAARQRITSLGKAVATLLILKEKTPGVGRQDNEVKA